MIWRRRLVTDPPPSHLPNRYRSPFPKMATTEDGVQTELQDYLNSKGINSLFISIVEALLVSKPEKPIQFIVEYLHKNHPEELSTTSSEPAAAAVANDDDDDSDDDDEDDDELGEIQAMPPPPKATRGRRVSVSAESMDAKQYSPSPPSLLPISAIFFIAQ